MNRFYGNNALRDEVFGSLDEDPAGSGRRLRQELKYTISWQEYTLLKARLGSVMQPDEHAGTSGEYRVSSLYFDNLTNDAWLEKESGWMRRAKYRIRIYDNSAMVIRLELKEKFGQSTIKSSRLISQDFYQAVINRRLNQSYLGGDPFLQAFYLRYQLEEMRPCVIVDYIREPYICRNGNVRITFDKKLQAVINTVDLFASGQIRATPHGFGDLILEVKYDEFLPEHVGSMLSLQHQQRQAISKYTICRELKNALDWKELLL